MNTNNLTKSLALASLLATGATLYTAQFNTAQATTIPCKWQQVQKFCGFFWRSYEVCVQGGNGNGCTCGATTRDPCQ